jgi:hypothetical protein
MDRPDEACPLMNKHCGMHANLAPIGTLSKATVFPDSLQEPLVLLLGPADQYPMQPKLLNDALLRVLPSTLTVIRSIGMTLIASPDFEENRRNPLVL